MEQEEIEIKDLDLDEFDRFLLALVKFYPEGKKQKELAEEAGIDPSLISKWKKGERGRAKEKEYYKKFFTEYIDTKEYIISKTLKLKIVPDLFDKLIEIARKDNRAKEIIGKSKYLEELVLKNLKFIIKALSENLINLEKAREIFLKMLEAVGFTKDNIAKKLNISEKALSVYLKIFIEYLVEFFSSIKEEEIETEFVFKLLENKSLVIKRFLSTFINYYSSGQILPDIFDKPPAPLFGSREEVKEFFTWVANNIDWKMFVGLDILRQYLLSLRGENWILDRWINIGCTNILIKQKLILDYINKMIKLDQPEIEVVAVRLSETKCPLNGNNCNVKPKEFINCKKIRKIYKLGNFEAYKEVIEK